MEGTFVNADEVSKILGVSKSRAYVVIKSLNNELAKKGYMVVCGRVSRQYFNERFYGISEKEGEK